jgi:glycosyltransferase involved in cell wall biosynthesis
MYSNKTPKMMIIIGVEPLSLINFRGDLIKSIEGAGVDVLSVSSALTGPLKKEFVEKKIKHESASFKRNGLSPVQDLKTLTELFRLLRNKKPSFVLAYTVKPVIWGGIAASFTNTKFYALITGLGFAFQGQGLKRKTLTKLVCFLYKLSLINATKVIFQNEDNRRLFVERNIVQFEKTEVISGSGVDVKRFQYVKPSDVVGGVCFLCIARLLGEKGLREYAKAAEIVKKTHPKTSFILVGPEDTSPDGISLLEVEEWTKNGAIEYNGSASDIRPFLEKAHVFVLPSYHEGLPRSTIEAMSVGRPIITTNAVGCKETVEQNVNGFKVPVANSVALAEKIIWFIEHPDQIEPMGLASRKIAEEKFDVHKVNARMLEIMGLK